MIRGIIIRIRKKTSRRKIKGSEEDEEIEGLDEDETVETPIDTPVETPLEEEIEEVITVMKESARREQRSPDKMTQKTNTDSTRFKREDVTPEVTEETVFVLPGDMIGTNEEFAAGSETFVRGSDIFSLITGTVSINKKRRTISVIPNITTPPVIKEGDIVVGEIFNVRDSMVLLRLGGIQGAGEREFQAPAAAIHVSNVKEAYVKDMSNEFGISDIVKGKVIDLGNMRLSTSGAELGVMKASCPVCHTSMQKDEGKDKLKCPSCGKTQSRKLAAGYGTGIV
ncbi:MAG: exosome complex RNA-binding protein Csl4 [Methanosarcinaceae archaeon]|nr:exosome complex RNA-binding protein Csl4 [Methanosarcinaceae archaeon]MDF1534091.1 exosome complex RNA-binding protein Csl4 [Methanosarcinaceae archaeon]